MHLHLFSSPGRANAGDIVEAARPYLASKPDPIVAYLPLATLADSTLELTRKAFANLAEIQSINTETMTLPEIEAVLRDASIAYIPGGNTFLLNHRLHLSRAHPYLRKKVLAGLPLVAFSAGTVLCGPNILTSNDMNMVETPHLDGLDVTPFNFLVHYAEDEIRRAYQDQWVVDYHVFHDNPVVLMLDGAYVRVDGKKTTLVQGEAWILRKGCEKQSLEPGTIIQP